MAQTAENLVAEYGISRADQDAFAVRSQQRYARAQVRGFFAREIAPYVHAAPKQAAVTVEHDEHPRAETTLEGLGRLKGVVRPDGSVTAGNSSGINDGAAALLIASEAAARRHGLTRVRGSSPGRSPASRPG